MFDNFKENILSKRLDDEQLFQKFFVDNSTYFFELDRNDEDWEYELKKDIANVLGIHINDIYIVGSAKTGFSMKPKCRGRGFDGDYFKTKKRKDRSDIDIAIVSNSFFDFIQENIYDWSLGFRNDWNSNKYYHDGKKKFDVSLKYKFLEYLGKGWYRPDFAPTSYTISTEDGEMDVILNKWKKKLKRKVAFAIYKNWHFFKKYQMENISNLRDSIQKGTLL